MLKSLLRLIQGKDFTRVQLFVMDLIYIKILANAQLRTVFTKYQCVNCKNNYFKSF